MRSTPGVLVALLLLTAGCSRDREATPGSGPSGRPPSILLVTLDTTRADSIGPDAAAVQTPAFNGLAARGQRFRQAYATVPETLPSHSSMMTGLYPAGHGVHENARFLSSSHPVLAEKLQQRGYRTAAFVSSFVLARRFGLARGFEVYDDGLVEGAAERTSHETTSKALEHLSSGSSQPQLVWVHYFDPHTPYAPAEPFRSRHTAKPYLGEVEAMDAELGRLIRGFEEAAARSGSSAAIIVAGDHGEGLGDHGEQQHGNLLYQSTMHVPLVVVGPGVTAGTNETPVSIRRIFHTILDWAGLGSTDSLRGASAEVVLGEAMKPFLSYGWQPQIMAVQGQQKAIFAGTVETYDLGADPGEQKNLGAGASLAGPMRKALDEYPVPSVEAGARPENLTEEARRNLASLGYVSGTAMPVVRKDAPRPVEMAALFPTLDAASGFFVRERYEEAIPLLGKILAADPHNLDAALRLATSYSMLGQEEQALEMFRKAAAIAPRSTDVRLYRALHDVRGRNWERALPILEHAVKETPDRLAAKEGLALAREKQGQQAMGAGETMAAIDAFEKARALLDGEFRHDLELGVLYLSARRLNEAREALDRVPPSHPEYAMALFKRAQVSVLLNEPDRADRIAAARRHADATTRELIERERLFRNR